MAGGHRRGRSSRRLLNNVAALGNLRTAGSNCQHGSRGNPEKERAPRRAPFFEAELALGGPDAVRPRALLALLDVEADGLATAQTVEVERRIDATLMEEILLTIVGGNEPKSAVGNDLLDGALWHVPNSSSRTRPVTHRPVRERRIRAAREIARRPDDRR